MKFRDIKTFPVCNYSIHVPWESLEEQLERYNDRSIDGWLGLNLDPPFQREHVWNEQQQIDYVEYMLKEGPSSRDIYFNHPGWNSDYKGEMVIVDGKQRLEAVRKFMRNELEIFGTLYRDYEDRIGSLMSLKFNIAALKTMREVYQWYLGLNAGGTPHTKDELEKVREMLKVEDLTL